MLWIVPKYEIYQLQAMKCIFLTVLISVLSFSVVGQRSECFPFERLPPDQRKAAEELLLRALDEEALYTIVGGLKPMSSGFQSIQIQTGLPRWTLADAETAVREIGSKRQEDLTSEEKVRLSQSKQTLERRDALTRADQTRVILAHWRCGDELFADLQHFARQFDGKRFLDALVISRPRLRHALSEKADFFSRWGITVNSHPLEVVYGIDTDETSARFAGYGYLFGYPDHAVRFFVQAADEEVFSGKFISRDFISIPTFARETNNFVYAVPKGHMENDADKALKARAAPILAAYKKRRGEYVGDGKKGVVEMLRDWFCDGRGQCSPANAKLD
ncbi:MAG: hypothetical protein IPJ30_25835 [Acidobacteria bacterium]|nr:hypothetical protein [Acidobacteriota bacterium]